LTHFNYASIAEKSKNGPLFTKTIYWDPFIDIKTLFMWFFLEGVLERAIPTPQFVVNIQYHVRDFSQSQSHPAHSSYFANYFFKSSLPSFQRKSCVHTHFPLSIFEMFCVLSSSSQSLLCGAKYLFIKF